MGQFAAEAPIAELGHKAGDRLRWSDSKVIPSAPVMLDEGAVDSLLRLQEILKDLPVSSRSNLGLPSVLAKIHLQSDRYGFLHGYLHSTKPFEKLPYDERVQLVQQLEFTLGIGQNNLGFSERQQDERQFYNGAYSKCALNDHSLPTIHPDEIPITNCGMEPFVQEVLDKMMPLQSKKVLEIGGGGGLFGIWMAMQGAQVTIIDVANQALDFARAREAELRGRYPDRFKATVHYRAVPAEHLDLEFETARFDFIFAYAVVHHLETESLAYALEKILKPQGTIFFCYEPFYFLQWENTFRFSKPVLAFFPKGGETRFERRLQHRDIAYFKKYFDVQLLPCNFILVNLFQRVFINTKRAWLWSLFKILLWPMKKTRWSSNQFGDVSGRCLAWEYSLLRKMPFLKFLCGTATLILRKNKSGFKTPERMPPFS